MRLPDAREGDVLPPSRLRGGAGGTFQGGYWRTADGTWMCGVPAPGFGVGNLSKHDVVEHDDGTITVSPSILVETGDGRRWHGFLNRGVWEALDDCVLERPA